MNHTINTNQRLMPQRMRAELAQVEYLTPVTNARMIRSGRDDNRVTPALKQINQELRTDKTGRACKQDLIHGHHLKK
jgi:hypothetical protein